jgi:hypothetical protein
MYLYGYIQQIRSSRRLETECRRNVELMWLLGRLYPDHKSIAEFRRMHRDAITAAGTELVRFARSVGLIRGEWIAIDGTKFRAAASADSVHERQALSRYLDRMENADAGSRPPSIQQQCRPRSRSCDGIRNRKQASCRLLEPRRRLTTCRPPSIPNMR